MIQKNNTFIHTDWFITETAPNACKNPSDLNTLNVKPINAIVPGTVAQAYLEAGQWNIEQSVDFDSKDYWYKTNFTYSKEKHSPFLVFNGLSTLCEVWLNDELVLSTDNMFIAHTINATKWLKKQNTLLLCFRSLNQHLTTKRPRPRWKTKLVNQQQLRWVRTSLLGRIPGWMPPVAPVGPWQAIYLQQNLTPVNIELSTATKKDAGYLTFSCQLFSNNEINIEAALNIEDTNTPLAIKRIKTGYELTATLEIQNIKRWWPHTHGKPHLYTPKLTISINNQSENFTLNDIGFKDIQVDQTNDNFNFIVNNKPIFCRGACWTINDIVSLNGDSKALEQTLTLMRDAGANMIRIGGIMVYEQEHFYSLCDKLGIMVWQDFMFANMDYPIDDAKFTASVNTEIKQAITRLRQHACISMYCGNSEIEQQAAMLGLPQEEWQSHLFTQLIPNHCAKLHHSIPYVTSTPTGGTLPFHTNKNLSHYYGVGAYQRPIAELRQHNVKFTSECLGFANIPISRTRNKVLNGQLPVTHDPKWKQRTPRDTGTGWDFEDIRDHYTQSLFNIDSIQTRSYNSEHYLALSEITTGEIMSQVFAEWRSTHSQNSGGLIWFLKDLWRGAGWGIIDSDGQPKACYYYLKRCWQPINVVITNETLNGLDLHVINETQTPFTGTLNIALYNNQSTEIIKQAIDITLLPNETTTFNADKILSSFYDTTYSYRFGPPKHNVVAVELLNNNTELVSNAFYFPNTEQPYCDPSAELSATAVETSDNQYELTLTCNRFMYAVNIDIKGYIADNNFFHMSPNSTVHITMKKINADTSQFKGYVSALNLQDDIKIQVQKK